MDQFTETFIRDGTVDPTYWLDAKQILNAQINTQRFVSIV